MPKIFRGTTPQPMSPSSPNPSSQDGGSLGKPGGPTKPSEPVKKKYSTKSQYTKYQTRQDPTQGSSNNVSDRLSIFKAKHHKDNVQGKDAVQEEKSVFKQGIAKHSLELEKKALREYSKVTGKSYRQVEANKKEVLKELGLKGQKWHRKDKIMRGIAGIKKRIPHMKSWDRAGSREIIKTKERTFGINKPSKKKGGWF